MSDPAPRAIRAISCDMDGTLYPVRRLRVAWRLRYERGLLVALMAAREKLRRDTPSPDGEQLLDREAELVAPSFGLTVPEARERIVQLRRSMPEALTRGASPYPGVVSALEAAIARGIKIAVLSDYPCDDKLRWLALEGLPWQAKIAADELGALKPHPRAFLRLAEDLGVEPAEILHIGDSEDLDVDGAIGAGMRVWRFSPKGRSVETRAEQVFTQWGVGVFAPVLP